ncbi:OsmC family protein [bacterium]|nr:OsmC family protein [bacterium]
MNASHGKLTAEVRGEVETEDNVLVIKRIHVVYHLSASADAQEVIERVHSFHHNSCPVYRSLHKAIQISTEYQIEKTS